MMESNYRPLLKFELKLLKIMAIFEYINSLLVKDTHDTIFSKKTSSILVDNGSSLNIPITIKIIALPNRTLIETSVLVVYLLLCYLIFIPPLLCTSSWRFEICLPSLYNLIEFSPDDQNTPKHFVPIKHTNIYISSNKYVLKRSLPMEVQLNGFPLS
jgi:hypothetical protein